MQFVKNIIIAAPNKINYIIPNNNYIIRNSFILQIFCSFSSYFLLSIAKYITTAVILNSRFGEVEQKWIIYFGGILAVAFTLGWGLYLVRDKKKGE